jgi:hypothetical protein
MGLFGVTDPADTAWLRTMKSDEPVRCFLQPVRLDNPAMATISRTHIAPPGSGGAVRPDALTDLLLKAGRPVAGCLARGASRGRGLSEIARCRPVMSAWFETGYRRRHGLVDHVGVEST